MDTILVHTGSVDASSGGLRFWGPFDNLEEAQKFMKTVHPDVQCDWAVLESPPTFSDEPQDGVIEGEIIEEVSFEGAVKTIKKIKDKSNIVDLPPVLDTVEITNEHGKVIGYQTIMPGAS